MLQPGGRVLPAKLIADGPDERFGRECSLHQSCDVSSLSRRGAATLNAVSNGTRVRELPDLLGQPGELEEFLDTSLRVRATAWADGG